MSRLQKFVMAYLFVEVLKSQTVIAADIVISSPTLGPVDFGANSLTITASGIIVGSTGAQLLNSTGQLLLNNGEINATSGGGNSIAVSISQSILSGSIINNGTMVGSAISSRAAVGINIDDGSTLAGSLINNGTISVAGGANTHTVRLGNTGTLNQISAGIINNGSLLNYSSDQFASGIRLNIPGSILGGITNNGLISSGGRGIYTQGDIDFITNYGTISGGRDGISVIKSGGGSTKGYVGEITNFGVINGADGYSIRAVGATIESLKNVQGGNGGGPSTTALTYFGVLPINYSIIINNSTHYGQLNATSATGSMTFGVYSGSTLSKFKQSYGSVLSGVSSSQLTNTTGSVSGRNWRLISRGNDTYDLEIDSYFNLINNYRGLTSNRDALLGAMHERYAVLNAVSQYDCNRFDKYGVCISMQSRATGWGSQTTGAGVFNIAYRPHSNIHAGVYLDYQVAQATPFGTNLGSGGIQHGYNNPTFGGYVGFSQSGYNGTAINAGLQVSVSGGYNPGKITVTRALLDGTEPGQGTAGLNAYYAYGTIGYGYNLAEKTIAVPYAGLLYTNVIRNSYTEGGNYLVQAPLGYNAFYEQLLTGVVGGRVQSMITDKLGANVGAGAQFDLTRNANSYSGYSYIEGMEAFGIEHGGSWNGARPTGQAGVFYNVTKNEQLLLNAYAGQQAYTTRTYTSLLAGYQLSF